MAMTCYRAALRVMPDITIMAMAATAQERAVRALGCDWVGEIFADRAYEEDGRLVDRKKPGAVIHDANLAAERVVQMVNEQAIITAQGSRIPTKVDTVCLHGDGETAVQIATALRRDLETAGVEIRPF